MIELTEQTTAAVLLASAQALELRLRQEESKANEMTQSIDTMRESVLATSEFVSEDRALDGDLDRLVGEIRSKAWALYDAI